MPDPALFTKEVIVDATQATDDSLIMPVEDQEDQDEDQPFPCMIATPSALEVLLRTHDQYLPDHPGKYLYGIIADARPAAGDHEISTFCSERPPPKPPDF